MIYNSNKLSKLKLLFNNSKKDKHADLDDIIKYYNENNRQEYCRLVEKNLLNALKNKFNIDSTQKLNDYIDNEKAEEINNIINKCKFELYSGKSSNNEDYHTMAMELIKYIKELKIKK